MLMTAGGGLAEEDIYAAGRKWVEARVRNQVRSESSDNKSMLPA